MTQTTLDLIHFNDVYHVAPASEEPVGGASRFTTALRSVEQVLGQKPLVLFSGDAFNPSLEGSITRGTHMTGILNRFGVDCACVGNHDFDFGVPQLQKLLESTNFPWLLSNVVYDDNSSPDPVEQHRIITYNGVRIGVIGLVEKEWIETIPSFPSDLTYHDFVAVGKKLANELRDPNGPHKADLVFALTHMRVPNDVKLARECHKEIDLVLGGHDHFFFVSKSIDIIGDHWSRKQNLVDAGFDPEATEGPEIRVVKSGTDFREFSHLKLDIHEASDGRKYIQSMTAERKVVDSSIVPDEATEKAVQDVATLVSDKTKRPIGYTTVPLDGRSSAVRMGETNLGSLTADLMLVSYRFLDTPADFALCCGGTIRNDSIIPEGQLTLGDLMLAFPFQDPVVVVRLTGQQIWDALENGVSEYPKHEGRFPQIAGLRLEWNPNKPCGERVRRVYCIKDYCVGTPSLKNRDSVLPDQFDLKRKYLPENMDPLDLKREYVVVTRNYMCGGYDGFSSLVVSHDKYVIDEENGLLISTLYRKFFLGLKYLNAFRESYASKRTEKEREEDEQKRIKDIVARAARHWRNVAGQLRDMRLADEKNETRAAFHCTNTGMRYALEDATKGHPDCIKAEDEEEALARPEFIYPGLNGHRDESWVKRWASISPTVQGRIVIVDD